MKKYILYGAASIGNEAKNALEKCGGKVVGYIDKRAFELTEYNGLPVWGINDVPSKYVNSNMIVFLSVKNVFEHEKIAGDLKERGFSNIIYKPYNVLLGYGSKEENDIARLYDRLFNGELTEDFIIPRTNSKKAGYDFAKICEKDKVVTAYIPTEFIFTNNYESAEMKRWGNVCILAFFTHIDFFRFLNCQKDADPSDYLEEFCVFAANLQGNIKTTEAWKENVIENRTQIFEQMKEALDLDPEFFVRNAAEAEWNADKKIFNLTSGKHRCTFQVALGKKYIPVKISRRDYDLFLNSTEVDETLNLLMQSKKEVLIPHPLFYRGIYIRDRSEYYLQSWFARYYGRKMYYKNGKITFDTIEMLDFTDDSGNFARFAKRLGCHVIRKVLPDQLEKQINRLLFAENIDYQYEKNFSKYKIVIIEADKLGSIEGRQAAIEADNWIIKYGMYDSVEAFARKYNLDVVTEINARYQGGKILKSYLLESKDYAER